MAQKRKNHPSATNGVQPKRHRYDDADVEHDTNTTIKAQVDPTYGQRSAFPGLDEQPDGENLFYGPAEDGLEYLRMVRSEAKGVPNLLTSATSQETDLYQDYSRGYYDDGAYTAMPLAQAERPATIAGDEDIDPQEAYYVNLCDQFRSLHSALHISSPPSAPDESTFATAQKLNEGASSRVWRMTFLYTQPTPTLLSQLGQDTVIAGIAALEKHLAWKTLGKKSYLGAWAWGLLARCRSLGMMGSEEVGVIRDLGKKARALVRSLAAGSRGAQGASSEESEEAAEGVEEVEVDEEGDVISQDVHENGRNESDVIETIDVGAVNPLHKDVKDLSSTISVQETPDGDAAQVPENDPNKDHQLPSTNDNEIAEAQERLLTALHETIPSPPPDPPTISNHSPASSPLKRIPQVNDQASMPTPQRSSSPVKEAPSIDQVPLTMRIAATLDMIITIVGEEYGQKDLLEGRMVWD